jgi:hypothetical protein
MGVYVLSGQRTVRGYQADDLHSARNPPRASAQQMVALDRDRVASRNASRRGGGGNTRTDEGQRHEEADGKGRYRRGGAGDQGKWNVTELQDLNRPEPFTRGSRFAVGASNSRGAPPDPRATAV